MNAAMALGDMDDTAHTKNPSSRYFKPRNGISSQRGAGKFRPKIVRPVLHIYSDSVPTGQSQLQNAFRNRKAVARKVTSRNIAAGCMSGTCPVNKKYFRFIMPAIGSQPSTPAGRATYTLLPAVSKWRTQREN